MSNTIIIIQGEDEKRKGIHYEVDTEKAPIGRGGTGVVREGRMVDERSGICKSVAIKFLYDDMPQSMLTRSQREASIRILNENLVEMIGFVQTEQVTQQGMVVHRYHVVSELLHGVMLLDLLSGMTKDIYGNEVHEAQRLYRLMQEDRSQFAVYITRCVLSAVLALHDNGYIHRDIDPSNIMITDTGKVKLIDMGIAKRINAMKESDDLYKTAAGQFIGKAAYAAPEQVLGDHGNQNATTDIYAVGILLYQLLVGSLPFEGSTQEMLGKQLKSKMPLQNVTDKELRKIIKKATNKAQADRYQSASEFRVALDALKPSGNKGGSFDKKWLYIGLALAGAVAAVVAVLLLTGGKQKAAPVVDTTQTKPLPKPDRDTVVIIKEVTKEKDKDKKRDDNKVVVQEKDSKLDKGSRDNQEEIVKKEETPKRGTLHLSYGTYSGGTKNGYPHGYGKLTYSRSRRINRYDSKGRVANEGESVEGEFGNGFFISGKHCDVNGDVIERLTFPVSDGDVYDDK